MTVIDGGHVTTTPGFRAAGIRAGLKASGNPGLAVLVSDCPATAAGVFTTNRVRAYNVDRNRGLLAAGEPLRAVVVTAGNANVATGAQGRADTDEIAALAAAELGCSPDEVAVAQTGVIGVKLPMDCLRAGIPTACRTADQDGGAAAAAAICTTDTHPKHGAVRFELDGRTVTLGAMAKGAGMIHPNLATMLCFVTTDAAIAPGPLQEALTSAVAATLNAVSIDGDQSTSDTALVLANGLAGNPRVVTRESAGWRAFESALVAALEPLAKAIASDGEGATKGLEVTVTGAASDADARLAARAVAASNLVKCAVHGNDPNWGRIACAVGYSGAEVDQDRLSIALNGIVLMAAGEPVEFAAETASQSLAARADIVIDLGLGDGRGRAFGCDLTEAYVRFNAEYTT